MSEAESRIDAHLEQALEKAWERCELEIALVRDELLSVMAEKRYGQLTDDAPKLELAEKAIAGLRKQVASIGTESARQAARNDQLAGVAERLATLEDATRKSTKSLFVRCGANVIAVRKETQRADELVAKVATLEETMGRLLGTLLA